MMSTLQYDARRRPTASELLRHSFFKDHTISKDVYNYAAGKKLNKLNNKRAPEIESLKIGPNGITIENEDVDNSPLDFNKYKEASGIREGFDLRKRLEMNPPKLIQKPKYKGVDPREMRRKSMKEFGLLQQSVLLNKDEEYKPSYYNSEENKNDGISEFKSRIKDPVYPYYKSNNDLMTNIKIPSLNPDDRKIYKPRIKEIAEERPFKKYESNFNLAKPALVTSNKKPSKAYEVNFDHKRRRDDEVYKPSDSYAKRVLNVQQSLPELNLKRFNSDVDRSPAQATQRQNSIDEERKNRFSRIGANQVFDSFGNKNKNIFDSILSHQNTNHINIHKNASINELRWQQRQSDQRGFPTRQAETQRKEPIRIQMQTRPKELKYDLAERIKSRSIKTHLDDPKINDTSYKDNIKMRKKRIILEDSDDSGREELRSSINRGQATQNDMGNPTRNNTIASTHYLTAATGNRNTVMKTHRSPISSRGSEED